MTKAIKLTPGQLFLLWWAMGKIEGSDGNGFSVLSSKPGDAPFDTSLTSALGLAKRGLLSAQVNNSLFYITDEGRLVGDAYYHRSRDCAKCNSMTEFQMRSCMGPRQRRPPNYRDPDDEV